MKDLLIVGFGLAGLSVARHAFLKDKSFDVISDQSQLSSHIAGGIINPVAINRMKPVWQIEEFLPHAHKYYKDLDAIHGTQSFQHKIIQVFIHDAKQENNWFEAKDKSRLAPYLSSGITANKNKSITAQKIGEVKAGLVHLNIILNSAQSFYENKDSWISKTFDYSKLLIEANKFHYNGNDYKHIVFCEGFGVTQNPYFNDLGIYGNKGDYLIFKSKQLQINDIVKAKYFLIPLGNDIYKFGATYQREPLNHQPSEAAKSQMLEALDKMIDVPYELVDQLCGIRPTTRDRRPILGSHHRYNRMYILNGFGSRGAMISPLLGKLLVDHIFEQNPIPDEVSINRLYAQT